MTGQGISGGDVDATTPPLRITVLMALYNGETHLQEQLDSLARQDWPNWDLLVSDDGSTDQGLRIIDDFAIRNPSHTVTVIQGPRLGFARNFLHLLLSAKDAESVAICDQDDVWLPSKLSRAAQVLGQQPATLPLLYCARTRIVGPDLTDLALSPIWPRPFGFANALVQNVAAGNTIVLNKAALHLAQEAGRRALAAGVADIPAHDWWLYQIISGAGGLISRDNVPVLLYRQHPQNVMGRNDTFSAWSARIAKVFSGGFADWNARNVAALLAAGDLLTPKSRAQLAAFIALRRSSLPVRLVRFAKSGLYRQTRGAQAMLWFAALIGRL